mmetsp:Transcript_6323/g.15240  ORF Transcript_6323/g.15240 Transcript_6323/m.15240 type:complete len:85 (+) Transcript_6323:1095-1349(+)
MHALFSRTRHATLTLPHHTMQRKGHVCLFVSCTRACRAVAPSTAQHAPILGFFQTVSEQNNACVSVRVCVCVCVLAACCWCRVV